jgi:hypothetical protein
MGALGRGRLAAEVRRPPEAAMSDEHVTDTDPEPGSPHGVGESVTRQGNTLAGDGGGQPDGGDGGDRGAARSHAQQAEREENRLQGSVDPQRPGPDPEG